jgi:ZIP family zinc transporter
VLISAVAFELVEEAFAESGLLRDVALGLFAGCAVFSLGDALIDRMGGESRKRIDGDEAEGSPLAIVLGIVLDGIPESAVIGLTVLEGGAVSVAMLVAVFLSNLPEAVAATSGLVDAGWRRSRILELWIGVMVVSGLAALAGVMTTVGFATAFAVSAFE